MTFDPDARCECSCGCRYQMYATASRDARSCLSCRRDIHAGRPVQPATIAAPAHAECPTCHGAGTVTR